MGYLEQSTSKKASAVAGRAYGSASLSEPPRLNNRRAHAAAGARAVATDAGGGGSPIGVGGRMRRQEP